MGLESGTYISDLVPTNPVGATDDRSTADDHLQLIKSTIKNTFPNITGAVSSTQAELNILDGATLNTSELNILQGADTSGFMKGFLAKSSAALAKPVIITASSIVTADVADLTITAAKLAAAVFATASEVRTGTATGKAIPPSAYNAVAFGEGQTWQTVTRSSGTIYQNTTGRPIFVAATIPGNAAAASLEVATATSGPWITISADKPGDVNTEGFISGPVSNNHYYRLSGGYTAAKELR